MKDQSLEQAVEAARAGSREALETVLSAIQGRVYGLCVRMLWHPEDARDASQEILIRVMTHLGDFRGGSAFGTWVYRVAANYLLDVAKAAWKPADTRSRSLGASSTKISPLRTHPRMTPFCWRRSRSAVP